MKLQLKKLSVLALTGAMVFTMGFGTFTAKVQAETAAAVTDTTASTVPATGFRTENGKTYYYKDGVALTGWQKIDGNIYYFNAKDGGAALTGWNYLKSYSGGKTKYKYLFKKNGVLVTDLFSYKRSYIKSPMTIKVNLTTHNVTFYLYDSKKKAYIIPAKTVICSTARDGKSTKVGHYRLEKTTARKWFIYKKSNPWHYYQYGVHIKGCTSWFHSTMYRTTNKKSLIVDGSAGYNLLGTNQTTTCIRLQAENAKLIYDISTKTNKKARVWVDIYRSSNKGPFGKVTLKDTTGKLQSSQKYDPTDHSFAKK